MNVGAPRAVMAAEGLPFVPVDRPPVRRSCPAAAPPPADRRGGGGARHLRPSLCRLRAHGAGLHDVRHRSAPHGEAARLVSHRAGLAGAQRGLSRGRQELFVDAATRALAAAGCAASEVDTIVTISSTGIATPSLEARVAGPHGLSRRRRARAGVRPRLRRRRLGPGDRQPPGARRGRARPCCWSPSRSAPPPSAWTSSRRPTWSRPPCSATARRPASLRAGRGRASRGSRARASICGPTRSTSWAGRSTRRGLGVIFDRSIPPFAEQQVGPAVDEHPGAHRRGARVGRSLRLPSRRRQGDHGAGDDAASRPGHARPRARGAAPSTATCRRRRCCSCSSA